MNAFLPGLLLYTQVCVSQHFPLHSTVWKSTAFDAQPRLFEHVFVGY